MLGFWGIVVAGVWAGQRISTGDPQPCVHRRKHRTWTTAERGSRHSGHAEPCLAARRLPARIQEINGVILYMAVGGFSSLKAKARDGPIQAEPPTADAQP